MSSPTNGITYNAFLELCPLEHETKAVAEFMDALVPHVGTAQSAVHILSVSAGETTGIVAAKQSLSLNPRVTCSTAPHCLYFGAPNVEGGTAKFKTIPLIRDEKSQMSLVEALAAGRINLLSSQHFPTRAELKSDLSFPQAMPGATSLG